MPDENQAASVTTEPAETTAPESQTVEQTTSTGEAATTETSTASTSETKTETPVVQESKPVSRRSAQYRIEQLVAENKALKQSKPAVQEQSEETETQTDEQPDISKLVAKEVERRLSPMLNESTKSADDAELNEVFSGKDASERTKYEGKIRDMWKLPQYKDVAAADLYKLATFDETVKTVAARAIEEYKKAEKEARESSASGNSNNSNRTGKTATTMTDEEILANNQKVKAGQK